MLWKIIDNVKYEEDCEDCYDGSSNGNLWVFYFFFVGQYFYSFVLFFFYIGVVEYQLLFYFFFFYQQLVYFQLVDFYLYLGEVYVVVINFLYQLVFIGSQQQVWFGCQSQEGVGLFLYYGCLVGLLFYFFGLEVGAVSARRDVYCCFDLLLFYVYVLDVVGLVENLGFYDMFYQMDEVQNVDDQYLLLYDQIVICKGFIFMIKNFLNFFCQKELVGVVMNFIEVFCLVFGRLLFFSFMFKYKVIVVEVQR